MNKEIKIALIAFATGFLASLMLSMSNIVSILAVVKMWFAW